MINFKSIILNIRDIFQKHVNTNLVSVLMKHKSVTSPIYKPFYLDFLNYLPFIFLRITLDMYNITYFYETDGIIKYSENSAVKLIPLILSLNLTDENDNLIVDLKDVTKNYDNNISFDNIIKNEILRYQVFEYNHYLLNHNLFTVTNNKSRVDENEINYVNNLRKIIEEPKLNLNIKYLKNNIPINEKFQYSNYKYNSKIMLLSEI